MENITLITALLSFVGALSGSLAAIRYARRSAYERAVGELSARRKLDLIEKLAGLLHETLEILDQHKGADQQLFNQRDSTVILDELERALPLAQIYVDPELCSILREVRFWAYHKVNPDTNFVRPAREPDYNKAWALLTRAARSPT